MTAHRVCARSRRAPPRRAAARDPDEDRFAHGPQSAPPDAGWRRKRQRQRASAGGRAQPSCADTTYVHASSSASPSRATLPRAPPAPSTRRAGPVAVDGGTPFGRAVTRPRARHSAVHSKQVARCASNAALFRSRAPSARGRGPAVRLVSQPHSTPASILQFSGPDGSAFHGAKRSSSRAAIDVLSPS